MFILCHCSFLYDMFNIIDESHRKASASWDIVMTLVLSLGGVTHIHHWCVWGNRVIILLSVQAGVIKPINYQYFQFIYRNFIHHTNRQSNAHQSALHIWVVLLKPGRYCDMEVEHLKFIISYLLYCRWNYKHWHIICEDVVVLHVC